MYTSNCQKNTNGITFLRISFLLLAACVSCARANDPYICIQLDDLSGRSVTEQTTTVPSQRSISSSSSSTFSVSSQFATHEYRRKLMKFEDQYKEFTDNVDKCVSKSVEYFKQKSDKPLICGAVREFNDETCSKCFTSADGTVGSYIMLAGCSHIFCVKCAHAMAQKQKDSSCPRCSQKITYHKTGRGAPTIQCDKNYYKYVNEVVMDYLREKNVTAYAEKSDTLMAIISEAESIGQSWEKFHNATYIEEYARDDSHFDSEIAEWQSKVENVNSLVQTAYASFTQAITHKPTRKFDLCKVVSVVVVIIAALILAILYAVRPDVLLNILGLIVTIFNPNKKEE